MKKFVHKISVTVMVLVFYIATAQAEPVPIDDAKINELVSRHVLHLTHPHGYAESTTTLYFKPDHTILVQYPSDKKAGVWRIDNGKLCRKIGEKEERCGRILKDGDRYSYENNKNPLNIELRPLPSEK